MEGRLTILLQYGGRAIVDISKRFKGMLCLLEVTITAAVLASTLVNGLQHNQIHVTNIYF